MSKGVQITGSLIVGLGFGVLTVSAWYTFGAWTTMKEIETLGLIGQAAYESEYNQSLETFRIFATAIVVGFGMILTGSAFAIFAKLEEGMNN